MSADALLFREDELIPWLQEWQNMPEYLHDDLRPKYQVLVSFATAADVEDFGRAIGQQLVANPDARQVQTTWFPDVENAELLNFRYIHECAR
jgi:hypothetical protein